MKHFKLNDYILNPDKKIAKRMIYKDHQVIAFILNIATGAALPNHTHFDCTVLVQVIQGKATVNADDKSVTVETNDLIQLDGPENMSIQNTGDDTLILYVTISPAPPSEKYALDVDF